MTLPIRSLTQLEIIIKNAGHESLIHGHHTSQLKWPKHCPKKNPNSPPSKSGTSRTWGILNADEIQNKKTKPNKEDPQERSDNDPARKRGSKGGKQEKKKGKQLR